MEEITLASGAKIPNTKQYGWICILYPEDNPRHVSAIQKMNDLAWPYLMIEHNDDYYEDGQEKKHHVHVLLHFKNQRYLSSLSKELNIEPNLFRRLENFSGYVRYMLHMDNPERTQYNAQDFKGSLTKEALKAIEETETEEQRIIRLLNLLDSIEGTIQFRSFIRLVCDHGLYADCRRAGYFIKSMLEEHNREWAQKEY